MTDGAIDTVMERTRQEEIRLVRFLYADHGGIIRGKAAGTARLRERMSSGIGHTVAMMAMSMLDQLQPVAGMGPVGEVRIVPDPETFVALPYAPGAGAMLADLIKPDGSPWEACPRTFLKQALAELAGQGHLDIDPEGRQQLGHGPDVRQPRHVGQGQGFGRQQ